MITSELRLGAPRTRTHPRHTRRAASERSRGGEHEGTDVYGGVGYTLDIQSAIETGCFDPTLTGIPRRRYVQGYIENEYPPPPAHPAAGTQPRARAPESKRKYTVVTPCYGYGSRYFTVYRTFGPLHAGSAPRLRPVRRRQTKQTNLPSSYNHIRGQGKE